MRGRLLLLLAACGSSDPEPRPPLAECESGFFFARCGDADGEPRLACQDGTCFWFAGGQLAEGFVASDCPADDICCHDGWPFAATPTAGTLLYQLWGYGTAPWTAEQDLVVSVEIDPRLPQGNQIGCVGELGPDGPYSPCNGVTGSPVATRRDTLTITSGDAGPLEGWFPVLEIFPDTLQARVCVFPYPSLLASERRCPSHRSPLCASSGRVTVSSIPPIDPLNPIVSYVDRFNFSFEVSFPGGASLSGHLEAL